MVVRKRQCLCMHVQIETYRSAQFTTMTLDASSAIDPSRTPFSCNSSVTSITNSTWSTESAIRTGCAIAPNIALQTTLTLAAINTVLLI